MESLVERESEEADGLEALQIPSAYSETSAGKVAETEAETALDAPDSAVLSSTRTSAAPASTEDMSRPALGTGKRWWGRPY